MGEKGTRLPDLEDDEPELFKEQAGIEKKKRKKEAAKTGVTDTEGN